MDSRKNLPFKSCGVEKPIAHREPFSRTFGTNGGQQLPEAQLVGRMLLQRLATGATGVKQAILRVFRNTGIEIARFDWSNQHPFRNAAPVEIARENRGNNIHRASQIIWRSVCNVCVDICSLSVSVSLMPGG